MSKQLFHILALSIALGFTGVFSIVVVPPLIDHPDVMGAFAAGFVNPYAAGYASDVLFCWAALALWIVHEARSYSVRNGWICLLLGIVPGVAVGFALYLVVRNGQITTRPNDA